MNFAQKIARHAERHPLLTIAFVTLVTLGPFLNKAVHIDDPIFVWTAEHILEHPGDFYGFDVNWTGVTVPMAKENCNPPTQSYFLAAVMAVAGKREVILHGAMLFWAFAAAAGIFRLAQAWCSRPLLATLIAMATPVFLVSATTLMCDVPMFAIWTWAIVLWDRGLRNGSPVNYFAGATLAGLAVLTKYSALTLLPLLPLLGLWRIKRPGAWLLWLGVPIALIELYQLWTAKLYGTGLISAAADYAAQTRFAVTGGWANKCLTGLAYLGGCLLPVLFLMHRLWAERSLLISAGIVVVAAFIAMEITGAGTPFDWFFQAQMAVFIVGGVLLLALAAREFRHWRDPVLLTSAVWIGSAFVFASVLNWTVSARSFLPIIPPIAILAARRLEKFSAPQLGLPLGLSFAIGLWISTADLQLANSGRAAALEIARRYPSPDHPLWFEGHRGFQYYLQPGSARPVDFNTSILQAGDLMVIPSNGNNLVQPTADEVVMVDAPRFGSSCWVNTVHAATGAGFYGSGWLPFVFGPAPSESYFVYRIARTVSFAPPELLNNEAWQFATDPDLRTRNGAQAVRLAERACDLTDYQKTIYIGTLAAAYAEAGRFDDAIATAQKAVVLAEKNGETDLARRNRELLEVYRRHEAYHEAH